MRPYPDWATTPSLIWQAYTYGYRLDFAAARMGIGMFAAIAAIHLALNVSSPRARRVWWMYLPVLTALMESVGYATRISSAEAVTTGEGGNPVAPLGEVIVSFVLLLIPPIILAVVNYEVVGKVMRAGNIRVGCLAARHITRTFLSLDLLCFMIQCGAAPLMIQDSQETRDAGSKIIMTGLVLQFVVFLLFTFVSLAVIRKPEVRAGGALVRRVVGICLGTIAALLVRNGFRLYEYGKAYDWQHSHPGVALETQEWDFYVFDFGCVWAVHAVFAVWNFGWMTPPDAEFKALLQGGGSSTPSGAAAAEGAGAAKAEEATDDPSGSVRSVASSASAATAPRLAEEVEMTPQGGTPAVA